MKLVDRFLLAILALIAIIASGFMISLASGLISHERVTEFLTFNANSVSFITTSIIISIVIILISLRLLLMKKRGSLDKSTLLKNSELGMINVSLNTINSLTQKSVKTHQGVKDAKSLIISDEDGVRISLKLLVMPDVIIPELTEDIQRNVKEYVEKYSGIFVKEVRIFIDNIFSIGKSRVE
ncbi:MAG TPA: alkaline shock response membrane anchor protein AmaP [Clostridiales bacterium]|nr:alkaline shock response membrane anchor protein AmaP [Clostridiales bacterium]